MTPHSASRSGLVTRRHSNLLLAAAVMTTLLVTMGGIVCATESGAACPDWPGCYGRIIPPPQINSIIEYLHRFLAALTLPLVIAAAVVSWRSTRGIRWITWPLTVAIVFMLAVAMFGAFAVLTGLARPVATLDLGSALVALALVVLAATVARSMRGDPGLPDHLSARTGMSRFSLFTLVSVFAVYVGGILVAGPGSPTRCLGWPMWRIVPNDIAGWPQAARLVLSGLAALLVVALVVQGWRAGRNIAGLRQIAVWIAFALLLEMTVGGLILAGNASAVLVVVHVAAAAAMWSLLVVLSVLTGLASVTQQSHAQPARAVLPAQPG